MHRESTQRGWRRPDRPIGYGRQSIDESDVDAVVAALASDHLTQGPGVLRFERDLCGATGSTHAVACSSGTSALHLALLALGVGEGARVVTSANTFLASATAALHARAEVEFVDVELPGGNLDPARLADRLARPPRVDAVVAVHFAGRPCDLSALLELKRRHGFRLVVDGCHALGATAAVGERRLRVGEVPGVDAVALSFHPVKHVTTGEGGAVLFRDVEAAERARRLREHGIDRAPEHVPFEDSRATPPWFGAMVDLGFNYRLTELQAALGRSQLARLDGFLAARRRLARRYAELLEGCELPPDDPGHAWHLYVVRVGADERDDLMAFLKEGGIGTQLHYYPVPLQPFFRARGGWSERDFPNAVQHARRSLSLPLHPGLADEDQERVAAALAEWWGECRCEPPGRAAQ